MTNVVPIQSQVPESHEAKCSSCGATIVADQRYCLICGQPCSPVRLPFLEILQAESDARAQQTTVLPAPAGYLTALEPDGALGWLRRYSGLLALVGVLLVTGLIGLLIGHWTKSAVPSGPQIVKIEGAGLPLAAAAGSTTTAAPSSPGSTSAAKPAPIGEAQEKKEVKETEASTVKAPPPVKTDFAGLKKLSKTTGKAHQKEIESLTAGGKPIETGG